MRAAPGSRWRPARGVALATVAVAFAASCSSTDPVATAPQATSGPAVTAASPSSSRPGTTAGRGRSSTTAEPDDRDATTSSTDGRAAPDACTLITEQDASTAFGEPAVAGDQGTDECWWSTANDLKTINIIRRSGDIDTWRRGYQNSQWDPVGIGDEGYTGKGLDSTVFRIGDTTYEINVVYSTKGDPRSVLDTLVTTVTSRL